MWVKHSVYLAPQCSLFVNPTCVVWPTKHTATLKVVEKFSEPLSHSHATQHHPPISRYKMVRPGHQTSVRSSLCVQMRVTSCPPKKAGKSETDVYPAETKSLLCINVDRVALNHAASFDLLCQYAPSPQSNQPSSSTSRSSWRRSLANSCVWPATTCGCLWLRLNQEARSYTLGHYVVIIIIFPYHHCHHRNPRLHHIMNFKDKLAYRLLASMGQCEGDLALSLSIGALLSKSTTLLCSRLQPIPTKKIPWDSVWDWVRLATSFSPEVSNTKLQLVCSIIPGFTALKTPWKVSHENRPDPNVGAVGCDGDPGSPYLTIEVLKEARAVFQKKFPFRKSRNKFRENQIFSFWFSIKSRLLENFSPNPKQTGLAELRTGGGSGWLRRSLRWLWIAPGHPACEGWVPPHSCTYSYSRVFQTSHMERQRLATFYLKDNFVTVDCLGHW